ncbi:MAG TPA: hypothetical protein DDW32_01230 [Thermotoga sp.]|jgi:hypothetical protein|uniref:hypothetical protein n=1 Tax=Thermotoga sp. (strain RQ2) TaxID=126740 RepID=UPI00016017C9|nr:hypothetical protein [Thermotoga sp. RQ2]ACB10167.1 conserved hypothetical protein [Thermotoga sp. RQ2]HBF69155.1 hypothetical protein [Thermotoga sp.]
MVRGVSFLILLFLQFLVFPMEVLFNEYNRTGIISSSKKAFPFETVRDMEPFSASFETIYMPPDVRGITLDLPESTVLVLDNGVTIGTDTGDIRVPEDVFNDLLSSTDCTFVYDVFPVEVFSLDRIVVKGPITREKLSYYLSFFFDEFEVPGRTEGTIDVTPKPPEVKYSKIDHPLVGTVVFLKVTDDSSFTVFWNGKPGGLTFHTSESTRVVVEVKDSLVKTTKLSLTTSSASYEVKTFQSFLEFGETLFLPSYVDWYDPVTGRKINTFTPKFPGTYHLIGHDRNGNFMRLKVQVKDTSPPVIVSPEVVKDASSFTVRVYCDGKKVKEIPTGHHTVFLEAVDNFGNASSAFFVTDLPHIVKVSERPVLIYFGPKRKIELGGLSIKGNVVFGWTKDHCEVRISGEIFKIEK